MSGPSDQAPPTASAPPEADGSRSVLDALAAPIDVLPLSGRPFGRDESGRKLGHGSGRPTVGVVRHLLATVEERARREASAELPAAEVDARVADARQKALARLVELLNRSINDERYQLTEGMLLDESVNFSYEIWAVTAEYATRLTADEGFIDRVGPRMIPRSIAQLARPLGIEQAFAAVGRFANMFVQTDLRTVETTPSSAVVRWYGRPLLQQVPEENRRLYAAHACRTFRSTLAAVPSAIFGQRPADVRNGVCILDGSEYCEWRFAWQAQPAGVRRRDLALGAAASALVLGYVLLRLPAWEWVTTAAAALLPIGLVVYGSGARRTAEQLDRQQALLAEQREVSEREFQRSEAANQELQLANLDLRRRVAELTALHEIGQALSATLDLGELLDRSLEAVVTHLGYERGLVLLLDKASGTLGDARSIGGSRARAGVVSAIRLSLDDERSPIVQAFHADAPLPFLDVASHADPGTRQLAEELGVSSFLATPLITKAERVGVLAVDNGSSGRPVDPQDGPPLFTAGNLIAAAIETARLHAEVEQQNRVLEQRVAERTAALEEAMASAEENRALADLQRQEIENLFVISPVATIAIAEPDGRVTRWNPSAEKLFGWTAAEAIGRPINELVTTEEFRAEAEAYDRTTFAQGRVHGITRRTRKDGSLVDVEVFGVPILVDGERVGAVVIYHDITELQQARREAEEARAAADAANASKSAFLAMMSHEIRTPMNAIIGMSGLLLDTPLDREQRDYAETIRTSSDALLTIINDILDFSKIEAGRMELESGIFDVCECIEGALDLMAPVAAKKGLELAYVVEGELPEAIVGDVGRLRQILLNVLNNAAKFTDAGEIVLTASGERVSPDAARWRLHIAVRDTGIGIPADRMDRLFQSFSQADASTTRRYGGTGLGLAISKRLAELMGGTMWAESAGAGAGSTFHVTLEAEAAASPGRRRSVRAPSPELIGRRVLIVDDNATNRRIVEAQVRSWGMIARDTGSPEEALEWVRRGDPVDLVVVDFLMPGMDGVTFADEVRRARPEHPPPVLLLSSIGTRDERMRRANLAAHLTKPVKPSELYDAIVSTLARSGSDDRGPAETSARREPAIVGADGRTSERSAGRTSPTGPPPLRILLAEDNAVNQKVALRQLAKLGHRADIAGNGLEVLEALERQPYDVVLMDVQMPEMDGYEATRRIRARIRAGGPRIIAMTANAMAGDRERCLEAGMDDYVSKPVREAELEAALARVPAAKGA